MEKLATQLRIYRATHRLNQTAIAQLLGVTRQAVGSWEKSETAPSAERLLQLAKIINVNLEALLDEEEEEAK
jgi:transcriptional regulator with XRE-family HTH domain